MRNLLLALAVTLAAACNNDLPIVDQADVAAPTERGLGVVAADHLKTTEAVATKDAGWARALPWVVALPMLLTAGAATSSN